MSNIKQHLNQVLDQIRAAEEKYQRPRGSVKLLAVSKTWPLESILEAVATGQHCFGENYVQESVAKIDSCTENLEWHFIGHLQSNKSREIATRFDWVHSVDRLKLAKRLSEQRPTDLVPLNICLQVNIDNQPSKSGFVASEIPEFAEQISQLPNLKLRGLMAIPAPSDNFERQRAAFHQVATMQQQLVEQGLGLDTLSMGMSGDMEAAIAEGATIVRVGTAIFGPRHYPGLIGRNN